MTHAHTNFFPWRGQGVVVFRQHRAIQALNVSTFLSHRGGIRWICGVGGIGAGGGAGCGGDTCSNRELGGGAGGGEGFVVCRHELAVSHTNDLRVVDTGGCTGGCIDWDDDAYGGGRVCGGSGIDDCDGVDLAARGSRRAHTDVDCICDAGGRDCALRDCGV